MESRTGRHAIEDDSGFQNPRMLCPDSAFVKQGKRTQYTAAAAADASITAEFPARERLIYSIIMRTPTQ